MSSNINDDLKSVFVRDSIVAAVLALRPTLGRDFDVNVQTTDGKSVLNLKAHNDLGRDFIHYVQHHIPKIMEDIDEYSKYRKDNAEVAGNRACEVHSEQPADGNSIGCDGCGNNPLPGGL